MDAKEYLGRIQLLGERVKCDQAQREEILSMIEGIRSMTADAEKCPDGFSESLKRLEKVEKDYADAVAEYCEEKSRIIGQIHKMDDVTYETILYQHYVELKSFEVIAIENDYTYSQVKRLCPAAVKEFERVLMAS